MKLEAKSTIDARGGSSPRAGPIVHSVYVESADDWIVRRARRAKDATRLIVVTRDRQVAGRCRSAGCLVWSPHEFESRCFGGEPGAANASR